MSTCNFYIKNTSCYFSISENEQIDNIIALISSELEAIGYNIFDELKTDGNGRRHYKSFAYLEIPIQLGQYNTTVELSAEIRPGYFFGACLDWSTREYFTGETYPFFAEWAKYELMSEYDKNPGFATMQANNLAKRVNKAVLKEVRKLESIYAKYTQPLKMVGRFDTGSAIYEEVDNAIYTNQCNTMEAGTRTAAAV